MLLGPFVWIYARGNEGSTQGLNIYPVVWTLAGGNKSPHPGMESCHNGRLHGDFNDCMLLNQYIITRPAADLTKQTFNHTPHMHVSSNKAMLV